MVILTGKTLTWKEAAQVIFHNEPVQLAAGATNKIQENRRVLEKMIADKKTMYGINTGFGKFSDVIIEDKDLHALQLNLIHSHACGVGEPFSGEVSRAMLLLRANALAQGFSGVRVEVLQQLLDFLNAGIHPVVPCKGSLGASGDLAPLAHLVLPLLGEGEVFFRGTQTTAEEAMGEAGIRPLSLKAKEGLALINGTQAMTAVGVITLLEMEKLLYQSENIAAMTMEGLGAIMDAFDADLHEARGHKEQMETAGRIRGHLRDSQLTTRQGEERVQDAYSIRCIPQVLGACWQSFHYVKQVLETEMNAVTDNPLLFSEQEKVISGGNFHGEPVALAMDFLKLAIAEMANISERRVERLVNPQLNDLPPFLSPNPGLESGAMIIQYSAASLVSENKTLAHPASVDSIPSSANQEDHVSMGTIAARHACEMLGNTRRVIAMELICAMQAVEYRGVGNLSMSTGRLYEKARKIVPTINKDRVFSTDMEKLAKWLKESEESRVREPSITSFQR
ncbi:histidine ammonia-lyase [Virgibacillus kimchii]